MAILLISETREQVGSCNFCQRSQLRPDGPGLVFPYEHVALLGSDAAQSAGSMRLCPQCLEELRQQLATFVLPEPSQQPDK